MDNYLVGEVFVSILALFVCLASWIRRFRHRRDLVKVSNLGYAHNGIVLSEKELEALSKPIDCSHVKRLRPAMSSES